MSPDPRFLRHPLHLGFADPAEERAFRAELGHELAPYVRRGAAILALVFAAFAVQDFTAFRDHLWWLFGPRLVVVTLLLLGAWWAGTPAGRGWLQRHLQEYLLGLALVACTGLLVMSWVMAPLVSFEQAWLATLGFQLALVGVYAFSRLRFAYAVPLGAGMSAAGLLLLARVGDPPPLAAAALFGAVMNAAGAWITHTLEVLARRGYERRRLLAEARARSDALLRNALPAAIVPRLRDGGDTRAVAERYDAVTVVLADIVGFTPLCDGADPAAIGHLLDDLYGRFDELCATHGVEKIKTLGDAWLAASGVPEPHPDHEAAAARLALALRDHAAGSGPPLRIGLHTGPAVAGVVGRARFAYDLWGDAVDGAVAMERASRPGGIRVERGLAQRLATRGFTLELDDAGGWLVSGPPPHSPPMAPFIY